MQIEEWARAKGGRFFCRTTGDAVGHLRPFVTQANTMLRWVLATSWDMDCLFERSLLQTRNMQTRFRMLRVAELPRLPLFLGCILMALFAIATIALRVAYSTRAKFASEQESPGS